MMTKPSYQPPRLRNIVAAIVVSIALLVLLFNLSGAMKSVGNLFLYLPARLGIIQQVTSEEVRTIDLSLPPPARLEITRPGRYAVFTSDYDLLMTNIVSEDTTGSWLKVTSNATGRPITVTPVGRGLAPFDTVLAPGRPIFAFEAAVPGSYDLTYHVRPASIAVTPDYTTGKESLIVLVSFVQIAILLAPLGIVYYRRYQRYRMQMGSLRASTAERRAQSDGFWEAEVRAQREKSRPQRGAKD